jgi:large subunit ribosomal protein L32
MAHPKSRVSKARKRKRRTHYKITAPTVVFDKATGEPHLPHRAYWLEGKLYYRGRVIAEKTVAEQ